MTRDEITHMAREAGFVGMDGDHGALRRFAALVAAAEREACAKVAWDYGWKRVDNEDVQAAAVEISEAIQARGK